MAAFFTVIIGDGHTLPAANQFSVSVTQKSGAEWVMMACVSVIIMSPSVVNVRPFLFRCSISAELSGTTVSDCRAGAMSLVSVLVVSKFISVNVGVNCSIASGVMSSDAVMSKSAGTGNVSGMFSVSSAVGVGATGVGDGLLNADVWIRPRLLRARINAVRNSAGISGGRSDGLSTGNDGVSDSVGVGAGAGAGGAGRRKAGILIFGKGMVSSGFLFRTISVVVAMYSGNAANISSPNTKPAKPRSWACANLCHWAMFNILKLNRKYNIAHIANR